MCPKKVDRPNKENIQNKILEFAIEAITENIKFCRRLKHGGNLKWKNGKWYVKSTILHPVDVIIYFSNSGFLPKIKKPIHSEYSKCKIAAHVLGVHFEWISGFISGFYQPNISTLGVFGRKTDIGQQSRDGRDAGNYLHDLLLKDFFNITEDNYEEHSWKKINKYCYKCELCEIIGFKNKDKYFVNSNLNCGAGCAKLII